MILYDLTKWKSVAKNEAIKLHGQEIRRVTLSVNAPYPTRLYIVDDESGELDFLAKVDGLEELKFTTEGELTIVADCDDVKFYSGEWEKTSVEIPDAQAFVKIATRRQRNPELELIEYNMNRNFEKLMEHQAAELERRWAAANKNTEQQEVQGDVVAEQAGSNQGPTGAGEVGADTSTPDAAAGAAAVTPEGDGGGSTPAPDSGGAAPAS